MPRGDALYQSYKNYPCVVQAADPNWFVMLLLPFSAVMGICTLRGHRQWESRHTPALTLNWNAMIFWQMRTLCTDVQIRTLCTNVHMCTMCTDVHMCSLCTYVQMCTLCTEVQVCTLCTEVHMCTMCTYVQMCTLCTYVHMCTLCTNVQMCTLCADIDVYKPVHSVYRGAICTYVQLYTHL